MRQENKNNTAYTEQEYIQDTMKHIHLVQQYMSKFADELLVRAEQHDASKLEEPEKSIFMDNTLAFRQIKFGTPEYKEHLKKVQVALDHHYANNRHHAEYHPNGVRDMNLLDIVEMIADWKASAEKYDGDIIHSIKQCKKRFGFSDELEQIFINTVVSFSK